VDAGKGPVTPADGRSDRIDHQDLLHCSIIEH
jgi:hypothetical protein